MGKKIRKTDQSARYPATQKQETGDEGRKAVRRRRLKKKYIWTAGGAVLLIVLVAFLLLSLQTYDGVREIEDYSREGSDNYNYAEFADGIVRYSRDGVVYLNYENEELWNQPAQIQNPEICVNDEAFAIADSGGNTIMVFTEEGLKGEISTTLPIEKTVVSNQGIVAAVLKNEGAPKIAVYDTVGNVLVEHQSTVQGTGYPIAAALSDDANLLAVSYLSVEEMVLTSKVIYYNFGSVGQGKTDNQVAADTYENMVIPSLFFVDNETSVAVGDSGFAIYEGTQIPEKVKEIELDKNIRSSFHSDRYIGFVLENNGGGGYELRLYNLNGSQVMSENFDGEYGNVKISGSEVIMFEGSRACIFTTGGHKKFQGDLKMDVTEMIPVSGINTYLLMNANVVKKVRLTK